MVVPASTEHPVPQQPALRPFNGELPTSLARKLLTPPGSSSSLALYLDQLFAMLEAESPKVEHNSEPYIAPVLGLKSLKRHRLLSC